MRVCILTVGSYGDVRPYLALGRGLLACGHDVRLLGPDHYARFVEPAGVPFQGLGPYCDEDETLRVLAAMAAEPDARRHPGIALALSQDSTLAMGPRAIELTRDADVIVAHNFSVLGFVAAELQQKPLVTCHLFPMLASARFWFNGRDFGAIANRLLWRLMSRIVAGSTDPLYAQVLTRFGLPPRSNFFLGGGHSRLCNLIAVSPRVIAPDPDWPPHYESTGYWNLPEPRFEPDPELAAFMQEGTSPIVITFGSMVGVDAAQLTRTLVEAVAASGRRAVLQAGWAGLGRGVLSRDLLAVDFVPHDWLFARAACVVHHGGAGTTAAALRAGKPQVIVYHLGDQQFWCRHMQRLGVSRAGVTHERFSAAWLSRSLRRTLADHELGTRAARLGAALSTEDGVTQAVRAIERAVIHGQAALIHDTTPPRPGEGTTGFADLTATKPAIPQESSQRA
jgi:sterol 3beta-glucosyltransferase